MDLRSRDLDGFFGEMPNMIVTSSPIEGRRTANTGGADFEPMEDYPTWSALLRECQEQPHQLKKDENHLQNIVANTSAQESTSSSFEPIAEHTMKVMVTPGRKVHILSSSSRKILRHATPRRLMESYSRLSQTYRQRFNQLADDADLCIPAIKERIKSKETLTLKELERFEAILRGHIHRRELRREEDNKAAGPPLSAPPDHELMRVMEARLGRLSLSPSTTRTLHMQDRMQEKRLISLTIAKRKSAADIKRAITDQQAIAKKQIRSREHQEMKQIRASHLRQKAISSSTYFSQAHSAHHRHVVKEARQKANATSLQRKLKSEKSKNHLQANKIVRDVWSGFVRDQYNELRKEVREKQREQVAVVKDSEAQLQRLKSNYEEQLRELKTMATATAAEAGMEKREIAREIDRIQRGIRHQFQSEFQFLLEKVEAKGDHRRLIREEQASSLKERLQKANYVYDV